MNRTVWLLIVLSAFWYFPFFPFLVWWVIQLSWRLQTRESRRLHFCQGGTRGNSRRLQRRRRRCQRRRTWRSQRIWRWSGESIKRRGIQWQIYDIQRTWQSYWKLCSWTKYEWEHVVGRVLPRIIPHISGCVISVCIPKNWTELLHLENQMSRDWSKNIMKHLVPVIV